MRCPYPLLLSTLACWILATSCTQAPATLAEITEVPTQASVEPDPNHPFLVLSKRILTPETGLGNVVYKHQDPMERSRVASPLVRELLPLLEEVNSGGKSLVELGITDVTGTQGRLRLPYLLTEALPYEARNDQAQFIRQVKAVLDYANLNRSASSQLVNLSVGAVDRILADRAQREFSLLAEPALAELKPMFFEAAEKTIDTLRNPETMVTDDRRMLLMIVEDVRSSDYSGINQREFERLAKDAQKRIDEVQKQLAELQSKPTWEWRLPDMKTQTTDSKAAELLSSFGTHEIYNLYIEAVLFVATRLKIAGVGAAIEAYQRRNGSYPTSLSAVATQSERTSPLCGNEFIYRLLPDGSYELGFVDREGSTDLVVHSN